jgi:hypothetical protein
MTNGHEQPEIPKFNKNEKDMSYHTITCVVFQNVSLTTG